MSVLDESQSDLIDIDYFADTFNGVVTSGDAENVIIDENCYYIELADNNRFQFVVDEVGDSSAKLLPSPSPTIDNVASKNEEVCESNFLNL